MAAIDDWPAVANWTLWTGFGLKGNGRPAVERDPTDRLQVFARVSAPPTLIAPDSLWHVRQSGRSDPPWQSWEPLGGVLQGDPVVGKSYDGRLEVFARGPGGRLQHIAQTDGVNDHWAPWEALDGVSMVGNPSVVSNADGRLEVFAAVGTNPSDLALWHIRQTGSATFPFWSSWENLGGHLLGTPVAARNKDGRLEVFVRAAGNNLAHIWQTSSNTNAWSDWEDLGGGRLVGNPSVGVNADGRLEVFSCASDHAVWHIWQTATVDITWSSWASLGSGPVTAGDPTVAIDLDGRLEVFVRGAEGTDTTLWTIRQTGAFSRFWSNWENLPGHLISDPAVGTNWDGRLETFALTADRLVSHLWQAPPVQWVRGSTSFVPMGNGSRMYYADGGTNVMHDGTIYIYFADGPAPQYADPIGVLQPTGGAMESAQDVDFAVDRDVSSDFKHFDYIRITDPFSSIYPVPFRLDTSAGLQTLGQDQAPTGAFSYDNCVYVFAYARLLMGTDIPSNYPNEVPPGVPDGVAIHDIGQSVLTSSADPAGPFRQVFSLGPITDKFNQASPVVVKNAEIPGLPPTDARDGVIVLGQGGPGAAPGVYLAWMPLTPNQDPRREDLRYYTGHANANGQPWSANAPDATMLFATRYFWSSISLGRVRSTGRWIVLYQKTLADFADAFTGKPAGLHPEERHDGIYARIARVPWEWSPEVKIFDPDREQAWGPDMRDEVGGFAYGAFLLNPYTNWDAANRIVTFNYLVSPGSPYGVMLMRSQIQIND